VKRRRFNPSMVVALIALFVALSGTAVAAGIVPHAKFADRAGLALNSLKLGGKTPTQIAASAAAAGRCQPGSVQGIVVVTGQPSAGTENVPDQYTTDKSFFGYSWSCSGGAIALRHVTSTPAAYDVQFQGVSAAVAVGATVGGPGGSVSVERLGPGTFRVHIFGSETGVSSGQSRFQARSDLQFSLVAF
jgi:hypothetical protein